MNILFFLFPFILYLGIAIQAVGYYGIGLLAPGILFVTAQKKVPAYFAKIGWTLIFLYVIFTITNIIRYFFPNKLVDPAHYQWVWTLPGVFRGCFPSTFFFGGILLIVFAFISKKQQPKAISDEKFAQFKAFQPLRSFIAGLTFASIVYLAAVYISHLRGINFHAILHTNEKVLDDMGIPFGQHHPAEMFYGNTLTVASVCLGYAVFFWTLLWTYLGKRSAFNWDFLPFQKFKFAPAIALFVIAVCNLLVTFISNGRTSTVTAIFLFAVIPVFYFFKKNKVVAIAALISVLSVSYFSTKQLDIFHRIELTQVKIDKNEFNIEKDKTTSVQENRPYFWRTYTRMFLDNPVFGQGYYWLKNGVRLEYYDKLMGYQNLTEKMYAHNLFFEIIGCTGIFGLLWIITGVGRLYYLVRKNVFVKGYTAAALWGSFLFAFLANFLHGITQETYFDSSVDYIYLCLLIVTLWQTAKEQSLQQD